jgi:hypothetical protein
MFVVISNHRIALNLSNKNTKELLKNFSILGIEY